MPMLLFFRPLAKSYVQAHSRRLKDGRVVQIDAHYDKRVKKGTEHAGTHAYAVGHLDEAQRDQFLRMHQEQGLLHHYHGHQLRRRIANLQAQHDEAEAAEKAHTEKGNHKAAAIAGNRRLRIKAALLRHKRELDEVNAKVAGIGAMKDKLVAGSGAVEASTAESHKHYADKLGNRWKEKAKEKAEPKGPLSLFDDPAPAPDETPALHPGGKYHTQASKDLAVALRRGDMRSVERVLAPLSLQDTEQAFLGAGFSVASFKTKDAFLRWQHPHLAEALRRKTDGYGLQDAAKAQAPIEIPDHIKANLDRRIAGLHAAVKRLEDARELDRKTRGEGRYGYETHAKVHEDYQNTLNGINDSINNLTSQPHREALRAYVDARLPKPGSMELTAQEKEWEPAQKKNEALDAAISHLEGDAKQADIPADEKKEDAALVEKLKTARHTIIEHVTKQGKTLRGVVRSDLTPPQAKAIDPYTFRKDGGWFIRERHLDQLPGADKSPDKTPDKSTPAQDGPKEGDLTSSPAFRPGRMSKSGSD